MIKFSWYTIPKRMTKLITVYQYAVDRFLPICVDKNGFGRYIHIKQGVFVDDEDGGWQRYRPNMKGGHRHNHVRNATARMRKCNICGEPIVMGCEVLGYRFSEFQCRSCRTEECREQACLVGLSFGGCEFKIRRKKK